MGASFRLEGTATITGRGLVLTGQIAEGRFRIGDIVLLPIGATIRRERITGIELGDKRAPDGTMAGFVGLLVGDVPSADIPGLRAALDVGQLLLIENAT